MGRMLTDRKADIGSGRKGSVFPGEVHVKEMKSPRGAGEMKDYPDTEQHVFRDQEKGISKIKGNAQKSGYRN
jgi:hypothetical protein